MIQLLGIIVFALLLYLGQKYVYAKIWQRDLKVSLSFREDGIWEGQESELSEIIENRKRLPLTMLKVKFQTDRHLVFADTKGSRTTDRYYRNDIFQIGRLEKVTRALYFTGGRRGYYTIQEADLVASDLFLTAQYTATTPIEHCSLYVYPKPFSHPDFKRSLKQLNGEVLTKRHLLEDPFEYRGIRDYQPQDDLKSINWKATARTGDLKVNQKNYTSQKSVRIFVNLEDTGILEAGGGVRQRNVCLQTLARIDTAKPVQSFSELFAARMSDASNALYTCFVSPNAYEDFAALLLQYQEKHPDMKWFYPYSESTPPDPGEALKSLITFISLREESV